MRLGVAVRDKERVADSEAVFVTVSGGEMVLVAVGVVVKVVMVNLSTMLASPGINQRDLVAGSNARPSKLLVAPAENPAGFTR